MVVPRTSQACFGSVFGFSKYKLSVIIFDANPKNIHCFLPMRTEIRGHFIEGDGLGGSNEFGTHSQNDSLPNRSCQCVSRQTLSYTNTG